MNNVRNIINEWDPIGLFPYAPKDEYDAEIMAIEEILENNCDITVPNLAEEINNIFIRYFGEDIYTSSSKGCEEVSRKIWGSNR